MFEGFADLWTPVIPTFAPYLLPRLHPHLHAAFPTLTVRWQEAKTADLEAMLVSGELDVGLIADRPSADGLAHRVVGREPFVALLLWKGTAAPVRLAELASFELLLLDDGHCLRDQAEAVCRQHALAPSPFHATSLPTLVQMVASGAGATLLPHCAVAIETAHANVHARPLVEDVGRQAVFVWRGSFPRATLVDRVASELALRLAA